MTPTEYDGLAKRYHDARETWFDCLEQAVNTLAAERRAPAGDKALEFAARAHARDNHPEAYTEVVEATIAFDQAQINLASRCADAIETQVLVNQISREKP